MIKADQPTIFDKKVLSTAVSSVSDGSMKILHGDRAGAVENRRRFLQKVQCQIENGVLLYVGDQTVWDSIRDVTAEDRSAGMQDPKTAITADALVTNHTGVTLFLYTADCNAVIIHDPVKAVVALVHLGWQSTAVDLAGKLIAHLMKRYGSNPRDLYLYNGPSIRAASYILEPPIAQVGISSWQSYLTHFPDGKVGVDLVGYNRQQCIDAGMLEAHMELCPVDTATSHEYFSNYRANRLGKSQDEGRFVTVCTLLSV